MAKWTTYRGERHHLAKLSEAAVRRIKADDRPAGVVAEELGVSRAVVANVRAGRAWRHVAGAGKAEAGGA